MPLLPLFWLCSRLELASGIVLKALRLMRGKREPSVSVPSYQVLDFELVRLIQSDALWPT